ncbi:MAG: hypothetical protein ACR2NR_03325 [Solirubrobacteraceae bacterium]
MESGKRKNATFRWPCNHRLRNALAVLAHSSRMWNPWAADRYARARGHNHRRARRTLGRVISRLIWQCWRSYTPNDPRDTPDCNSTSPSDPPARRALAPTSPPRNEWPGPPSSQAQTPHRFDTGRLRRPGGSGGVAPAFRA